MTDLRLLPDGDDEVSPERALAAEELLLDDGDIVMVEQDAPPIGRSYVYDFLTGQYDRRPGGGPTPLPAGLLVISQWIEKCLRTDRGSRPIHPPEYGLRDRTELFGQVTEDLDTTLLVEHIQEALTFHPRITSITDITIVVLPEEDYVAAEFTVNLDNGDRLELGTNLT